MSTFLEALKPYQYGNTGMISLYTDGPCDNLFLITAHAIRLAERLGEDASSLRAASRLYALRCSDRFQGLVRRRPEDTGATSYDELTGAAVAHVNTAFEILRYGEDHWFCYDVENPGHLSGRFFFARNVCFVPLLKGATGNGVNLLYQSAWATGVLLSTLTERQNTSGKLLVDVQLDSVRGWVADHAANIFRSRLSDQYGGRRALYRIYFPPGHPIAEYQRDDFS